MVIYLLTSRNGACKIPTKSVLTSKQEFEFQNIIHSIISARRSLYKENDNEGRNELSSDMQILFIITLIPVRFPAL